MSRNVGNHPAAMRVPLTLSGLVILMGCGQREASVPTRQDVLIRGVFQPGSVDEATAIGIARQCVASNDTWSSRAVYKARRNGAGWSVTATRIEGYSSEGKPLFVYGGDRSIVIDERGAVTSYVRGR
jgi:hypothetical protein